MNFRTDLALERRELLTDREIPGVKSRVNQSGSVCVTAIEVQTEQGAQAIGKPVGSYITVEVPPFSADAELLDGRLSTVADELRALLPEEGLVLVVGIGNDHITPDALGPLAGERILATRHIGPELARSIGMEHLRPVAGLLPGVLGQTGIETGEIIAGVARAGVYHSDEQHGHHTWLRRRQRPHSAQPGDRRRAGDRHRGAYGSRRGHTGNRSFRGGKGREGRAEAAGTDGAARNGDDGNAP